MFHRIVSVWELSSINVVDKLDRSSEGSACEELSHRFVILFPNLFVIVLEFGLNHFNLFFRQERV